MRELFSSGFKTDKLTNEQRAKVAAECCPDEPWEIFGNYVRSPFMSYWSPDSHAWQWKALTQKVADLARVTGNPSTFLRVLDAIATNDTDALESLCWELMPK